MLTYILGVASIFLVASVMYFIKSRNKTEAVEMESRDDDVSIYPLEKNIDETRRDILKYDDGTCLECSIHFRKGADFPFYYKSREDRKRVTVYSICNYKEFIIDILKKLDKEDLIFIEDLQPADEDKSELVAKDATKNLQPVEDVSESDKTETESEEDLQPVEDVSESDKTETESEEDLQPVAEPKEESGSVSKNSTEDLQ